MPELLVRLDMAHTTKKKNLEHCTKFNSINVQPKEPEDGDLELKLSNTLQMQFFTTQLCAFTAPLIMPMSCYNWVEFDGYIFNTSCMMSSTMSQWFIVSPPPLPHTHTVPSGHFCSFWEKEAELVNSIGHFADCDCLVELGSASNLSYVESSKSGKKTKKYVEISFQLKNLIKWLHSVWV